MIWSTVFVIGLPQLFEVSVTIHGHLNGLLLAVLLVWIVEDITSLRPRIYAKFGLKEPPKKHFIAPLRLSIVLAQILSGVIALMWVHLRTGDAEYAWRFWSSVSLIVSAMVAGVGWIFSNFQSEKTQRIAETELALRELQSDPIFRRLKQQTTLIHKYLSRQSGFSERFPIETMKIPMRDVFLFHYRSMELNYTQVEDLLEYERNADIVISDYLNYLERFSFGVRSGRLDFDYAYEILSDIVQASYSKWCALLREDSQAKLLKYRGHLSLVRQNTTYEHFLWLSLQFAKRRCRSENVDHRSQSWRFIQDVNPCPWRQFLPTWRLI